MNNDQSNSNILDKIMGSQTQSNLSEFEPKELIANLLLMLKERDSTIVSKRFGLGGAEIETLEAIGKLHSLTRERVRQIEKDSINTLKKKKHSQLERALQLVFDTIIEHGGIISEDYLLQTVLINKSDRQENQAVKFLLNLGEQFRHLNESTEHYESWYLVGFDMKKLAAVDKKFEEILEQEKHAVTQDILFSRFRNTDYFKQHSMELNDKILKSYLNINKNIQINPFSEIGLKHWSEVNPRDVGDKAYLVLKHHKTPEHYSQITKMINDHKFDNRTAYQETVHNELIKDKRFVLVGRGIYALADWGYKKGVVADVIKEILKTMNRPLSREEIISEVMKKRQVKRNTILVGLSNKKNFMKVGNNKYALVEEHKN